VISLKECDRIFVAMLGKEKIVIYYRYYWGGKCEWTDDHRNRKNTGGTHKIAHLSDSFQYLTSWQSPKGSQWQRGNVVCTVPASIP
jgi:hypothetical protein